MKERASQNAGFLDQLCTFLLPKDAHPRGSTLRFRIAASEPRILIDDVFDEMGNVHEDMPIRIWVWSDSMCFLNAYCTAMAEGIDYKLEDCLLIHAVHLFAAFPCVDRFVVDLTNESIGHVLLDDVSPRDNQETTDGGNWSPFNFYEMATEIQWS